MVPAIIDRARSEIFHSESSANANNGTENCDALSGATRFSCFFFGTQAHIVAQLLTEQFSVLSIFLAANGAIEMEEVRQKLANDIFSNL
jgi:hypothetical protein